MSYNAFDHAIGNVMTMLLVMLLFLSIISLSVDHVIGKLVSQIFKFHSSDSTDTLHIVTIFNITL